MPSQITQKTRIWIIIIGVIVVGIIAVYTNQTEKDGSPAEQPLSPTAVTEPIDSTAAEASSAEEPTGSGEEGGPYSPERLPAFAEFPVAEIYQGRVAPIDLDSHPNAREFRTVLQNGVQAGPNFAGHYILVTWEFGTGNQLVAIVDAMTGRVHFAPFITVAGSQYRVESNLFIANPPEEIAAVYAGNRPDDVTTHYYRWEDAEFVPLYTLPVTGRAKQ